MVKKLLQPAPLPAAASAGLLVLRVVAGLAFVLHGWVKIQHPFSWMGPNSDYPGFLLGLAALSEFGGGIAWILGLLTPLACFGIACTMLVALRLHVFVIGDPFVGSSAHPGSFELPAVYLALAVLLALAGPGRFSVDRCLFGQKAT
jgi:putative oxidoreductase